MRKIMMTTALAAALAATTQAQQPVDSGNIVGYAKLNLNQGVSIFGAVFQDIKPTPTLDLDIKSIMTSASYWDGANISWWNGVTRMFEAAQWGDGEWVDYNDEDPVDYTFSIGEGFKYSGKDSDVVTVKGELFTSQPASAYPLTSVTLYYGVEIFVNPMPVELDIRDISTDAAPWGGANISWWDGTTRMWEAAQWGDNEWVDYNDEDPVDYTFSIGEGFKFSSTAGKSLFFPNPLQ